MLAGLPGEADLELHIVFASEYFKDHPGYGAAGVFGQKEHGLTATFFLAERETIEEVDAVVAAVVELCRDVMKLGLAESAERHGWHLRPDGQWQVWLRKYLLHWDGGVERL